LVDGQIFSDTSLVTVLNSKGGKPNRSNGAKSESPAANDAYFAEFE
jgi:hypothetical protein